MSLPLWDPIDVPPGMTLVDVNSIADEDERMSLQAQGLALWIESQGMSLDDDEVVRDWSDSEGMFVLQDAGGDNVGIVLLVEVESA